MSQSESIPGNRVSPRNVSARDTAEVGQRLAAKKRWQWSGSFYFLMSLLVAVTVVYGFGHKLDEKLLHAATPRPAILFFHAILFAAWVVLFTIQAALIRTRNIKAHKAVGWFGLALGTAIPFIGIATAYFMIRMEVRQGLAFIKPFFIVAVHDMLAFAVAFALAFWWRRKPEFHRRLMFVATCALTSAAFARIPWMPNSWFYAGVDCLILFGVVLDLLTMKRIHPVYLYGFPTMIAGQIIAMYILTTRWLPWMKIVNALFT